MALSNAIIQGAVAAYKPRGYISRAVSPLCQPSPVTMDPATEKVTGTGRRFRASSLINIGKAGNFDYTPGARRTQIRSVWEEYTLTITPRAVETRIGKDAYANLPETIGGTAQAQIIQPLGELLRLAEELKFVTALTTTGNWAAGYTGTSGNRWSDASYNALAGLQTAVKSVNLSGLNLLPNTMAFSLDAWQALVGNPSIRSLLGDALVNNTQEEVAKRLAVAIMGPFGGNLRVVVSTAAQNAVNNPAVNETASYVMTNFAWIGHVGGVDGTGELEEGSAISIETPSALKTYMHQMLQTRSYLSDDTDEQVFVAKEWTAPAVYDSRLGYYFSSIVTA